MAVDDVRFETQDGVSQSFGAFLISTSTDAFIAVRRGRVAAELYFDGMTPSTRHLLQSVSKSLCGTVAGALIGTGELGADDLVTGHVPELAATSFEGATVRHLLDMTAGTRFLEDYDDPAADVRAYERAAGWQPAAPGEEGLDLTGYAAALPNERSHGESFEYRSILTDVLGLVLERAGRAPLAELTSRLLWATDGRRIRRRDHCGPFPKPDGRRRVLDDPSRSRATSASCGCRAGACSDARSCPTTG